MAGLERWKERHPTVWPHLEPADVLVDAMRGRSSAWYRIRLNLRNVPEESARRRSRSRSTSTRSRSGVPTRPSGARGGQPDAADGT